ncbi:MAG TPA: double-strand break repair protein AddB [Beijerinckiaceae bacterium]|nr:double-strand break repair protein AddB [Beijerinckiaceae bacterium]
MARRPNLFSILAGAPFLPSFAAALIGGEVLPGFPAAGDPLALASATIYVPTRRAAKALAEEFAAVLPGPSALLPRIVPLGQMDEIESALTFEAASLAGDWDDPMVEAIDEFDRRLSLMSLILAWARAVRHAQLPLERPEGADSPQEALLVATTPGQAWFLARDLAGVIDELIIEDTPWSALDRVVPDEFDRYWAITLDFLRIAAEYWPLALAEKGQMEAAARRAALIDREARRLVEGAASGPVIAIGSTGTNRATARLLAAIAKAPLGALVLPGLDCDLDAESWRMLAADDDGGGAPSHPQAALRRLLRGFGADRAEVVELGAVRPAIRARIRFLGEALRPADTTELWPAFDRSQLAQALSDVSIIEAANEREEALALAIRLREALETPGLTAALVTPDRNLAARVRAELARWGVEIDDSGGEPLASTSAGALAELTLAAASSPHLSVDALAVLAHPQTCLGFERARVEILSRLAEIALMRTSLSRALPLEGAIEAARQLASAPHAHPAVRRIDDAQWRDLAVLLGRLADALAPLRAVAQEAQAQDAHLSRWLEAHAAALAAITDQDASAGEDTEALANLFERLGRCAGDAKANSFDAQDYASFFENVAHEIVVRSRRPGHPRLKILGLLEARLMSADVVLLGGLDETIWPPAATTDAFLNRPMRMQLGLSPPERRIGQTAHDFVQAMGAPVVVLSRAQKRGGVPTTPSRFLQRMQALAGESAWTQCCVRGKTWLTLARLVDQPEAITPLAPPQPRPPLALRPQRLSVTRIETLRRDPYAIYAESILRLTPLEPIDAPLGARDAGMDLHELLAQFATAHPFGPSPPDAARDLHRIALQKFERLLSDPEWRAFHWPRLERGLHHFVRWDAERRTGLERIDVEQRGELSIALADGSIFVLSAQADRIEHRSDGGWTVIDYKSGRVPTRREIECGFAPQLTLESAMIERGAFVCAPGPARVADALYVQLGGGTPLCEQTVGGPQRPLSALAAEHFEGLVALLSQFRTESTPYASRPFPQFASRFGTFDHLARVKEWSAAGLDSGDAE